MSQPESQKYDGTGVETLQLEDRTCIPVMTASSLPPAPGTEERRLAERRLVRKLDCRLLPATAAIYTLNYIDVRTISSHLLPPCQQNETPEDRHDCGSFERL